MQADVRERERESDTVAQPAQVTQQRECLPGVGLACVRRADAFHGRAAVGDDGEVTRIVTHVNSLQHRDAQGFGERIVDRAVLGSERCGGLGAAREARIQRDRLVVAGGRCPAHDGVPGCLALSRAVGGPQTCGTPQLVGDRLVVPHQRMVAQSRRDLARVGHGPSVGTRQQRGEVEPGFLEFVRRDEVAHVREVDTREYRRIVGVARARLRFRAACHRKCLERCGAVPHQADRPFVRRRAVQPKDCPRCASHGAVKILPVGGACDTRCPRRCAIHHPRVHKRFGDHAEVCGREDVLKTLDDTIRRSRRFHESFDVGRRAEARRGCFAVEVLHLSLPLTNLLAQHFVVCALLGNRGTLLGDALCRRRHQLRGVAVGRALCTGFQSLRAFVEKRPLLS
mmetsp:Transcript_43480/g.134295  ORF Transcript_43480/g.134295 Transcript_43480/m.134295 type:complete len:397 (+) Transcript_43480:1282-2472(+)